MNDPKVLHQDFSTITWEQTYQCQTKTKPKHLAPSVAFAKSLLTLMLQNAKEIQLLRVGQNAPKWVSNLHKFVA